MKKLGTADLEIIRLGIGRGGTLDERDIEGAGLGRMGTGRILDVLASLRERGLLEQDGSSFRVTGAARGALWDEAEPLWAKTLRLLQTRSCTSQEIAHMLMVPHDEASREAEALRSAGHIIMSPQRRGGVLLKIYEIQEEGASRIDRNDAALDIIDTIEREIAGTDGMDEVRRLLGRLRGSL